MENNHKHINEDDVEILGINPSEPSKPKKKKRHWLWILLLLPIAIASFLILRHNEKEPSNYYRQANETTETQTKPETALQQKPDSSFIEVLEETINDVPLLVYAPHHAHAELALGIPDRNDKSIIFATQAADVGGENFKIVGDYILAGEQLARGQRKDGFCAIIDHKITIGFGSEPQFLQEAINQKGYFFRQYPLVKNAMPIDNKPKGKSIRRALAIRNRQVIIVESRSRESFHDFAQALADIGVSDAVYLVGGSAFGWYRNQNREQTFFGKEEEMFPNPNYLIWKTK